MPVRMRRLRQRSLGLALGLLVCVVGIAIVVPIVVSTSASAAARASVRVQSGIVWSRVDGEALTLDVYRPIDSRGSHPGVLLIHGGAWQGGHTTDLEPEAVELARLGYVAVSVTYRFAPEHVYPAAVHDVERAVIWMRKRSQVRQYGIDPHRVGVLGVSAGGNLASLLGTLGEGRLDTGSRVAVVVSWSGVYDFLRDADGSVFFGCKTEDCPQIAMAASPITHVDATDAPTLMVHAMGDGIVPISQGQTMEAVLARVGVPNELVAVPGYHHAQQLMSDAWPQTVSFLDRYLKGGVGT